MNESHVEIIDPVCGMTVTPETSFHEERDGTLFYFCSSHCKEMFLSTSNPEFTDVHSGS